jgi:hypothetical protein
MRYFIYLSAKKIEMLFPQLPKSMLGRLASAIKFKAMGVEASLAKSSSDLSDTSALSAKALAIERYLCRKGHVQELGHGDRVAKDVTYISGRVDARWGRIIDYASDIAFFGGSLGRTHVALIGSAVCLLGSPAKDDANHAPDYYLFRFWNALVADQMNDFAPSRSSGNRSDPRTWPYFKGFTTFERLLNAAPNAATLEFLARVLGLYSEAGNDLVIATPMFVSYAEPSRRPDP